MIRKHLSRMAMTLIELSVALALGIILIGIMVSVWTTSQKIMSRTTDNILIYQNLRNILDLIERDVANVVRTTDMEFFDDKNNNGHYDLASGSNAEEFAGLRDSETFYVDTDSSGAGSPNPALPDGAARDLNNVSYFYAPTLVRPSNYEKVPGFDDDNVDSHRRDEFYFRSFALVNGESRPVLIHYRLRVPTANPQRPTLVRRLAYVDRTVTPARAETRVDELAEGVTDLEFAMFYKESRIHDHGQFLDAKQLRAIDTNTGKAVVPGLENQFNATAASLYYTGTAIIERTRENGIWMRPEDGDLQFGAVRPGDRFFLFDAEDDDSDNFNTQLKAQFGQRFLTVGEIIALQPESDVLGSTASKIFIKFTEPIDFSRLIGSLAGEIIENVTEFGEASKKRTVYQDFRVKFRVGFLPGAFRVRFKYRDFRARRLVPFQRVIRVLGS